MYHSWSNTILFWWLKFWRRMTKNIFERGSDSILREFKFQIRPSTTSSKRRYTKKPAETWYCPKLCSTEQWDQRGNLVTLPPFETFFFEFEVFTCENPTVLVFKEKTALKLKIKENLAVAYLNPGEIKIPCSGDGLMEIGASGSSLFSWKQNHHKLAKEKHKRLRSQCT